MQLAVRLEQAVLLLREQAVLDGNGPESGVRGQKIDNAFYQGLLRAYYNHPDTFRAAEFSDSLKIQRGKVDIGSASGGAGVPGSNMKRRTQRALSQFPRQSVFPAS